MESRIPSSSQTVGPFFTIGLDYLIERMAETRKNAENAIEIRGRVLDRDGAPVPDAMLEFWSAVDGQQDDFSQTDSQGLPDRFGRSATDEGGNFRVKMTRPQAARLEDGREQSPHLIVLVFARGLLRHLISRVYLEDESGNESDPALLRVPVERRATLVAKSDGTNAYRWNVILQGENETVFFAW